MDWSRVGSFAIWAIGLYGLYIAILFGLQRSMIYMGRYVRPTPGPAQTVPGLEVWQLETEAGPVEAWFIPAPTASTATPAPTVIFSHGNGEAIDNWVDMLLPYNDYGLNLLLVEYPGYGRSAGTPSQASIEATLILAYDRLITRPEVDPQRIIAHGRSLGGGAACRLAAKRPIAALILQSTFASLRRYVAARYLAPGFLLLDPFDNLAAVRDFAGPILIIHGRNDRTISIANARTLAQVARQATLITYPCGHNDCPPDWDQYWTDVATFLQQHQFID